jgi:hypothetical protein
MARPRPFHGNNHDSPSVKSLLGGQLVAHTVDFSTLCLSRGRHSRVGHGRRPPRPSGDTVAAGRPRERSHEGGRTARFTGQDRGREIGQRVVAVALTPLHLGARGHPTLRARLRVWQVDDARRAYDTSCTLSDGSRRVRASSCRASSSARSPPITKGPLSSRYACQPRPEITITEGAGTPSGRSSGSRTRRHWAAAGEPALPLRIPDANPPVLATRFIGADPWLRPLDGFHPILP